MDSFERLGLPRRFSVDPAALEAAYLSRSRAVHPDFHALGGDAGLVASEAASAELNEAYATLKDSFRRAEHLLTLVGGPTATAVKDIPPAFLMEMMDLRERIEAADAAERERIEAELNDRYATVFAGVAPLFEKATTDEAARLAIRRELNAAKYLKGLLRDLRS